MMSYRFIEFAIMMATTNINPSDSSYEIIWAEDRNPPSMACLLFEAQPASTIPYTAMEAMAPRYSTPTLILATASITWRPNRLTTGPKGMTAAMIIEGTIVTTGAQKKRILSAFAGTSSSLKISFTASAIGWSRPRGPARFGPMRD